MHGIAVSTRPRQKSRASALAWWCNPGAIGRACLASGWYRIDSEAGMLHVVRQIQRRYPEHATAILVGALLASLALLAAGIAVATSR